MPSRSGPKGGRNHPCLHFTLLDNNEPSQEKAVNSFLCLSEQEYSYQVTRTSSWLQETRSCHGRLLEAQASGVLARFHTNHGVLHAFISTLSAMPGISA
jgi:hypothetical protein